MRPKFEVLWFEMYSTHPNLILHTSWQCNCHDMHKILLWSVAHMLNYSTPNFDQILNSIEITLVGQGPGTLSSVYVVRVFHTKIRYLQMELSLWRPILKWITVKSLKLKCSPSDGYQHSDLMFKVITLSGHITPMSSVEGVVINGTQSQVIWKPTTNLLIRESCKIWEYLTKYVILALTIWASIQIFIVLFIYIVAHKIKYFTKYGSLRMEIGVLVTWFLAFDPVVMPNLVTPYCGNNTHGACRTRPTTCLNGSMH